MVGVRVLVVEDERLLADAIADGLRRHSLAVDVVYDGGAALERSTVNDYDVVVLDRDLPLVSGDDVCAALIESNGDTRILMLTAATAVVERVAGLASSDRIANSGPTASGRGAGLGLSIVRSVVHAHDGEVSAVPRPDGGLTVTVVLPRDGP